MKRINLKLAVLVLGVCAFQVQAEEKSTSKATESNQNDPNRVVGKVGGQSIRQFDVTEEMRKLPAQYQQQISKEKLYASTLQQMALQMAVVKKARDLKIDQSVDYKKAEQEIKLNLLREMFLFGDLKDSLSEEGLKNEYDAYLKSFKEEEEVKASHILIKEESEAKDIIAQIKAGGDFAKIAEAKSLDYATAKRGGDLDFFKRAGLIPEFTKVAFDELKDGQMTETPVKSSFGWHVIKREASRTSKPLDFDKAKTTVLPNNVRQRAIQSKMKEAIDATKIELTNLDGSPLSLVVPGITEPLPEPVAAAPKPEEKPASEHAKPAADHASTAPVPVSAQEVGVEAGKSIKP